MCANQEKSLPMARGKKSMLMLKSRLPILDDGERRWRQGGGGWENKLVPVGGNVEPEIARRPELGNARNAK